jgi:hypothetical protein
MKQLNEQPSVLIADDEIPYDDERDRRTREAFRKTRPQATDEEYLKGCNGMRGAVEALKDAGFDPAIARRFEDAERLIAEKSFDVAVIDLGWAAQPELDDRERAGVRLVEAIRKSARGHLTRVIMYSSRFDQNVLLARTAVDLGTLPLLKTYTPGSHQTLTAAVRFLSSEQRPPDEVALSKAVQNFDDRNADLRRLYKQFRTCIAVVAVVMIAGVTRLVVGKTTLTEIQVSGSLLVTLLLGYFGSQIRAAVHDADSALSTIIKQVGEMRPARGTGLKQSRSDGPISG